MYKTMISQELPLLCSVCAAARPEQLVPERSEEWCFYPVCTLCLDAMLTIFPLRPRDLLVRELTARLPRRRQR